MNTREIGTGDLRVTGEALPPHSKRCPRCGELLFDDMDVCYGCLYDFTREPYHLPEGMIETIEEPHETDVEEKTPEPSVTDVPFSQAYRPVETVDVGKRKILLSTRELSVGLPIPPRGLTIGLAGDNDVVLRSKGVAEHHLVLVARKDDVVAVGLAGHVFDEGGMQKNNCAFLHEGDSLSVGGLILGVDAP